MGMRNDDIFRILRDLVETLKDASVGYHLAAGAEVGGEARKFFSETSRQRDRFARQLEAIGSQYGEPSRKSETGLAGRLHRGWQHIFGAIQTEDTRAILAECERGEDRTRESYEDALAVPIPAEVNRVLASQFREIRTAPARIRSLHEAERAGSSDAAPR